MKYIRFPTDLFDDTKIKAIRSQKDGDSLCLLYLMLVCTAAKSDCDGSLMLCSDIPYDEKILSSVLNMPSKLIKDGINIFMKLGMLAEVNSSFSITHFDEFLPLEYNTEKRQKNAERQRRYTERQRLKKSGIISADSKASEVSTQTSLGQAT